MKTRFARRMLQLALSGTMLLPATLARAGDATPVARTTTQTSTPGTYSKAVFDDLTRVEDPKLENQRAGYYHHHHRWSTGEIVLVVLLLIFLFPIGLIVLIVLFLSD